MTLSHHLVLVLPGQPNVELVVSYGGISERKDGLYVCSIKFDSPFFSDVEIAGIDPINSLRNAFKFFDEIARNLTAGKLVYPDGTPYEPEN